MKICKQKKTCSMSKYTFGLAETALGRHIMVVQIIGLSISRTLIQYLDCNFAAKVCNKFTMNAKDGIYIRL